MAKRLSENEKIALLKFFNEGKTIDKIALQFNCTKSTIVRNIKKIIGEDKYKQLNKNSKKINKSFEDKENLDKKNNFDDSNLDISANEENFPLTTFTEITPLNLEIDNAVQKDLASVPISDMNFPKVVYMIVDKKIELETKYLREYPEWQFLSEEELNRKTIEIHIDMKTAKRFCNKEQKVIKVPNTNVFKIAAPILMNKGISRIVSPDKLISL